MSNTFTSTRWSRYAKIEDEVAKSAEKEGIIGREISILRGLKRRHTGMESSQKALLFVIHFNFNPTVKIKLN